MSIDGLSPDDSMKPSSKSSPKSGSRLSSRRSFLRAGGNATAVIAAYPALGSARVAESSSAAAPATLTVKDFELDEITIDDVQKAFQSGQYSSRSLTEKYLQRIAEIDQAGPRVNSV